MNRPKKAVYISYDMTLNEYAFSDLDVNGCGKATKKYFDELQNSGKLKLVYSSIGYHRYEMI